MKNVLLFVPVVAICLTACVEVPPAIDFSEPVVPLKDSTYIASPVPAPQHKAVVIEDVTGVRCVNCPDAAMKANDIVNLKSEDSVVVIAQYPIELLNNFTYPWPGVPQLANEISKQIVEALGIPQGLPTGYVDRKKFPGKTQRDIGYQEWINYVNQRLKEKTPVNIHLSKIVKDRNLKVEMKLQYNSAVSATSSHRYAIYLLEDNIVSTQLENTGENHNYVHNHVLRQSIGLAMGTPLTGPYDAGKTYVKQFEYEIPAEYVIANCHLVCVVLDATNNSEEVINVRAIHL